MLLQVNLEMEKSSARLRGSQGEELVKFDNLHLFIYLLLWVSVNNPEIIGFQQPKKKQKKQKKTTDQTIIGAQKESYQTHFRSMIDPDL